MSAFQCFHCHRVIPLLNEEMTSTAQQGKCPSCGGRNGQIISSDRVKEGLDAGVFYNIDPKTGGPAKKKRP